jgi:hypothetical protein
MALDRTVFFVSGVPVAGIAACYRVNAAPRPQES